VHCRKDKHKPLPTSAGESRYDALRKQSRELFPSSYLPALTGVRIIVMVSFTPADWPLQVLFAISHVDRLKFAPPDPG
jgi:hypothetical protein